MRTSVSEPAGPDVATAADGVRRRNDAISGSPRSSISDWPMMVTLAAVSACCSGAREAVMTIGLGSMGNAGMIGPPVDEPCRHGGQVGPRFRGWSRPKSGRLTTAGSRLWLVAITVAGTAPDFRRLPFE